LQYCVYSWGAEASPLPNTPTTADIVALDSFLKPNGLVALEEDCVEMSVQDETMLDASLSQALQAKFLESAGANFIAPIKSGLKPTHVAVLDTWTQDKYMAFTAEQYTDGGVTDYGNSDHGYLMWKLISDLTSHPSMGGGPMKMANVAADLALPSIDNDRIDREDGGHFGRLSHVARSVCKTVDDWEKARRTVQPGETIAPLVINLSLGAEPYGNGCDDRPLENMTVPMQGLVAAIEHASCHGAAIIAAAGNRQGDGCNSVGNMMCPAAMFERDAPTRLQCSGKYTVINGYDHSSYALYDPQAVGPVIDNPLMAPLVYAASGIDPMGRKIAVTRPNAMGPLAAIATLAGAQDHLNQWHGEVTGTSIAAAVLSSAFATIWAYRPDLDAPHVAQMIYNASEVLPDGEGLPGNMMAEVRNESTMPPEVRKVDICRALRLAYGQPLDCPSDSSAPLNSYLDNPALATSLAELIQDPAVPMQTVVPDGSMWNLCSAHPRAIDPAPGPHPCLTCGYLVNTSGIGQAYIHINSSLGSLSRPTVVLRDVYGNTQRWTAENPNMSDEIFSLVGINSGRPPSEIASVYLEFANASNALVMGEIPIVVAP